MLGVQKQNNTINKGKSVGEQCYVTTHLCTVTSKSPKAADAMINN